MIPCDLVQADAGDQDRKPWPPLGLEVEYVVNNAGYGLFGRAVQRDRADQLDMITVNIHTLHHCRCGFSDQLIRNRGGLFNVGSIARLHAGSGHGGLLRHKSLCAVVHGGDARRAGAARRARDGALSRSGAVGIPGARRLQARLRFARVDVLPADVAQQAYRGLMANKRAVMPGIGIKIVPFLLRFFPRSSILGAVGRLQLHRR